MFEFYHKCIILYDRRITSILYNSILWYNYRMEYWLMITHFNESLKCKQSRNRMIWSFEQLNRNLTTVYKILKKRYYATQIFYRIVKTANGFCKCLKTVYATLHKILLSSQFSKLQFNAAINVLYIYPRWILEIKKN